MTKKSAPSLIVQSSHLQQLNLPKTPQALPIHSTVKSTTPRSSGNPTRPSELPAWALARSLPFPSRQIGRENSEVIYNIKTPPKFRHSLKLQKIVNDVVNIAAADSLPSSALSIALIDAKTGETAGHQQDTPRYPASVVKIFWMVVLYAQIKNGIWYREEDFTPYLAKMLKESDNEAASLIIDLVTGTRSQPTLKGEKFRVWKRKRQQVNRFFQQAGYKNINIVQKTFPIYHIDFPEPKGSESQLLGDPIQNWNKITTRQAARLVYEICYAKQAVSPEASKKMSSWLKRDLNPKLWKQALDSGFNPVQTFFGEALSNPNVKFYSKAGWTSRARNEVAMIDTGDKGTTYILAVFSGDSAYAEDVKIFPKISRLIYKRMTKKSMKDKG